ncbi:RecQ family ATP-dependent DNA helicase [Planosporangium mesophilum]|nr:RecQ family ATP-dependent DNA helicase [Planosporangium mesophilum]
MRGRPMGRLLPPNLELARELLSARGSLSPDELAAALRDSGVVLSAARLAKLPDRYPDAFALDERGHLVLPDSHRDAENDHADESAGAEDSEGPAWLRVERPPAISIEDLVFIATRQPAADVAALRLRDGRAVLIPGGPAQAAKVREFADGADGVVCYGAVPDGSTVLADLPGALIDLRLLALLDKPDRPCRRLSELCAALGVELRDGLVEAARATAECLRILVEKSDLSDVSWRLAAACLVAGGSDLVRVLPAVPLPREATDGIECAVDPLLALPETATHAPGTAYEAVRDAFARLGDFGYAPRRSQREMADTVAGVLDSGGLLAVEAPTGTGKSLAYLVPASGRAARPRRPVVVATATKVLQQQLRRDVARLQQQQLFRVPFRQLFGVANYICPRELANGLHSSQPDAGPEHWLALAVAVRALATGATGVWDEVADADVARDRPGYAATRSILRTDSDSCERAECEWAAKCPLFTRLAGMAERPGVVAVNHALVAAWAKLAREGVPSPGDVLAAGVTDLIFDEAHELEDSLTSAWTESVGRVEMVALAARLDGRTGLDRQLRRLAKRGVDLRGEHRLPLLGRHLLAGTKKLTDTVDEYLHEYGGSARSAVLRAGIVRGRPEYRQVWDATIDLDRTLQQALLALTAVAEAGRDVLATAPHRVRRLLRSVVVRATGASRVVEKTREILGHLRNLGDEHLWVYRLSEDPESREKRESRKDPENPEGPVDWAFECIPIDVSTAFANGIVAPARSVSLTSATLTTGGTFDFLQSRLGVRVEAGSSEPGVFQGKLLESPFHHDRQSAVVLTSHLPVPVPSQEQEFVEEFARDQVGFLSLTGGKALTLFAARKRMEAVADLVRQRAADLEQRGVQVLLQGEAGRTEISERFRTEPGTVVYGLRSYWQGFDAPGETLSYLVIEKPPYPHPDDPVVAARVRAIADRGGDPFLEYVVPKTAILFTQGFGRLIRTENDRGVALVCDRRMQSPSTANRLLLSTLPGPEVHYALDRDDAWRYALRFVTGEDPDLSDALALAGSEVDAILDRLRLVDGEDPEAKLREAARLLFGIEHLRDAQLELMIAHLRGEDTLGLLPTGSGKSLCFQLPALIRPDDRATVVVSPLVALIKDQLDDLRGRHGISRVQGITANTSTALRTEILRDVAAGKVRLLYVSPERLVRDPVLRRALERQELAALVVDEAHCISDWGHDFRPEFRQVAAAVADLGRAPRMALTATATRPVADDISRTLELDAPVRVVQPSDRPNLRFRVVQVSGERERARELLRIATAMGETPGIVYASRRAVTEEVAALLRRAGLKSRHYHAGMVPEQREAVQDDFFAGTTQVVVATKAFGMGVNKPDIGWVVHYDLPESLDAYVQEAGRAARAADLQGECVLLYSGADVRRRRSHLTDDAGGKRLAHVTALLGQLAGQHSRGADVVFDPEELADAIGVDVDELNVLLAWLERTGALEQQPDCSARGTVHVGLREPEDAEERRRFRELSVLLKFRPQVGSRIDFERLREEHGLDPDALERDLVAWSLDRLVTFSSSQRYRRVRLLSQRVDEVALHREVSRWTAWQRRQLDAMVSYARDGGCRRAAIVSYFGFPPRDCEPDDEACDGCGGRSPWLDLPASAVPDPELLVNVDLVVLQAVAWAGTLTKGRYGEFGLKQAVLGAETMPGGRPLGAGLQRCPQFGALRYVRANDRRWDEAVRGLIKAGRITREDVQRQTGQYTTLTLTPAGRQILGGRHG